VPQTGIGGNKLISYYKKITCGDFVVENLFNRNVFFVQQKKLLQHFRCIVAML